MFVALVLSVNDALAFAPAKVGRISGAALSGSTLYSSISADQLNDASFVEQLLVDNKVLSKQNENKDSGLEMTAETILLGFNAVLLSVLIAMSALSPTEAVSSPSLTEGSTQAQVISAVQANHETLVDTVLDQSAGFFFF